MLAWRLAADLDANIPREARRWRGVHRCGHECRMSGGLSSLLVDRETLVRAADRPVLSCDLAGTVAHAGADPTLEGRALQDALRREIARRRGHSSWDVHHASWVVTLHSREERDLPRKTREDALV